jgi:hypothetical protein
MKLLRPVADALALGPPVLVYNWCTDGQLSKSRTATDGLEEQDVFAGLNGVKNLVTPTFLRWSLFTGVNRVSCKTTVGRLQPHTGTNA